MKIIAGYKTDAERAAIDFAGNRSSIISVEVNYRYIDPPNDFLATSRLITNNIATFLFNTRNATAEVGEPSRVGVPAAKSLGVAPVDLNGDGWMDLVVANDGVQNFVFHNQRNGTFKEVGALSGIAFDSYGKSALVFKHDMVASFEKKRVRP